MIRLLIPRSFEVPLSQPAPGRALCPRGSDAAAGTEVDHLLRGNGRGSRSRNAQKPIVFMVPQKGDVKNSPEIHLASLEGSQEFTTWAPWYPCWPKQMRTWGALEGMAVCDHHQTAAFQFRALRCIRESDGPIGSWSLYHCLPKPWLFVRPGYQARCRNYRGPAKIGGSGSPLAVWHGR